MRAPGMDLDREGGPAMADHDIVLTWLNDAYSVENALVHVLERHAKAAKDFPHVQRKIAAHLAQTRRHAELIADRVTALGSRPSAHKDRWAGLLAPVQNVLADAVDEEDVLKNSISDYAAENFEIATYQALMTAAEDTEDTATAQVCQQILTDEREMAGWLDEHIPLLADHIVRQAAPTGDS